MLRALAPLPPEPRPKSVVDDTAGAEGGSRLIVRRARRWCERHLQHHEQHNVMKRADERRSHDPSLSLKDALTKGLRGTSCAGQRVRPTSAEASSRKGRTVNVRAEGTSRTSMRRGP